MKVQENRGVNTISGFQGLRERAAPLILNAALVFAFLPAALYAQSASFAGAQTTVPFSGLVEPFGIALDSKGDIFVSDSEEDFVLEMSASGSQTKVVSGLNLPGGLAMDANGDLFIGDVHNNRVLEVPAGGAPTTVPSGLFLVPWGVAVDGLGDVFVANTAYNNVVKIPVGGGQTTTIPASGLNQPEGVAVDGAGNVFIADTNNNRVVEVPAGGGPQTTVGSGLSYPLAVAVDAAGNVFIADGGNRRVVEVPANGGAQMVFGNGLLAASGVAVDGHGNIFIVDQSSARVSEIQRGAPNFGSVKVGNGSELTLNYNITAGGTLGAAKVLTEGAPSRDFTLVSGSTCTGDVAAGTTCAVTVAFAPLSAGLRRGAVQLTDASGNVLATTLIYGTGVGSQIAFGPAAQVTLANGLIMPQAVAVDGAGNVFIADDFIDQVLELPAGGGAQVALGSGLSNPSGVAVDGAGNLFIAESSTNSVVEVPSDGGAQTTVASGLNNPHGVAVDGAGDVFIADSGNNRVAQIPAGGGAETTVGSGLNQPYGVAVDGAGNVFIADWGNNRAVEVPVGGGAQIVLGSGLNQPQAVAVDAAGDVFIADTDDGRVVEVPAGGGTQTTVGGGLGFPTGLAVDGAGNVFIADFTVQQVVEIQRSQAPTLNFAATPIHTTSSPKSITVENIGNQPLNAMTPGLTIGTNFAQVAGTGTPSDCTSSFALAPGASCNLSISFTPTALGLLKSTVTLMDNALGGSPGNQSILLEGTGTGIAPAITSTSGSAFTVGSPGSFTLTATGSPAPTLSETGTLPSGLSFNASTGVLSGTPGAGTGGTYPISFTAANGVGSNATQNFTLTVGDFAVSASPASQTISSGHSASYTISLSSVGGLNGKVALTCSGNPPHSTCTVSPATVTLNGTAQTTVNLLAGQNVNHGTFALTFTGTLGNLSHIANVSLTVK